MDRVSLSGRSDDVANSRRAGGAALLLLFAVALYVLVSRFYVERGLPNADEGFYATVAHEVMLGRVPYRDFAYTQMPLLPYVQGAVMSVTGFGVREQRWINVGWGALTLVLGLLLWRREGVRPLACLALILVWCACKQLVYYDAIGKTYALAQLALLGTGACLFLRTRPTLQVLLFSLAGVLAIGCRLTVAPAVAILWIGLAVTLRGRISWVSLAGIPVVTALVLLGPFYASDPANAFFWSWEYHLHSIYPKRRLLTLGKSFLTVPGVTVLAALGLLLNFKARSASAGRPATWLLLAGMTGWVTSIAGAGIYTDYSLPFLPLVIVGAGCWYGGEYSSPRWLSWSTAALLAAMGFGIFQRADLVMPGYLSAIDATVAYVRTHTRPTDIVLTSMPEIPLQSGRPHFPGLEMGKFGLTVEMDATTAARRRLVTFPQLLETIETRAVPAIVLSSSPSWSFAWSVPSQRQFNQPAYQNFVRLLETHYTCTYEDNYFKVWMRRE